jgi:hypothetical protein
MEVESFLLLARGCQRLPRIKVNTAASLVTCRGQRSSLTFIAQGGLKLSRHSAVNAHLVQERREARLGADGVEDGIPADPRHHLRIAGQRSLEVVERTDAMRHAELIVRERVVGVERKGMPEFALAPNQVVFIASWNPVISWLRRIERLKFAE